MKAGLVCCLAAFKALVEARSLHGKRGKVVLGKVALGKVARGKVARGKIGFAATVDEEGLDLGARALLGTEYGQSAGILLPEPFGGRNLSLAVPLGMTGKVLYRLIVKGKMAHGFLP